MKDQDDEVRSKAIEGLWENEEASLVDPLVNLLEQDSSEKVQAAAATALGKIGGASAKKCLEQCLNNPSEVIRQAAEQALLELGMKEGPLSFRL